MMVGPLRGVRPCQPWRSEPQMLATVTRTRIPPGSTSGRGNSRASKGFSTPVKTKARAFIDFSSCAFLDAWSDPMILDFLYGRGPRGRRSVESPNWRAVPGGERPCGHRRYAVGDSSRDPIWGNSRASKGFSTPVKTKARAFIDFSSCAFLDAWSDPMILDFLYGRGPRGRRSVESPNWRAVPGGERPCGHRRYAVGDSSRDQIG